MTSQPVRSNDSAQTNDLRAPQSRMRVPLWVAVIVILGAGLTLAGAIISKVAPTLLTNGGQVTEVVSVYADYAFARDLALALMLLLLLMMRARWMLAGLMVLIALVQIVDAIDDLVRGAFVLAPGVLIFAIVFLIGASKLFGQAFWHIDMWHEPDNQS